MAERLDHTLIATARATLQHRKLPKAYWEDAVRDAAFKYNITLHRTTNQLPYTKWYGEAPHITKLHTFGALGTIPRLSKKKKLENRSYAARYMYAVDPAYIVVRNIETGTYNRIRAIDFQPYRPQDDPSYIQIPPPTL